MNPEYKPVWKLVFIIFALIGALVFIGEAFALPITGYEYLDNETLYLWNNGSVEQNWYYEADCLDQISNTLNDSWQLQSKGFLIDHTGDEFDLEVDGCTRSDGTDNLTFVENNRTKIFDLVGNKEINYSLFSYLGVNDEMIHQVHAIEPNFRVMNEVSYLIKFHNISIGDSLEYDYLMLFNRSDNSTLYFNLSAFKLHNVTYYYNSSQVWNSMIIDDVEIGKSIKHNWSDHFNFTIKINGNVTLYFHLGEFEKDENKNVTLQWVDAGCTCNCMLGRCRMTTEFSSDDGNNFTIGDGFEYGCKPTPQGGTCTTGCSMWFYNTQYSTFGTIMKTNSSANASDYIVCDSLGTQCGKKVTAYNTWHYLDAYCRQEGNWSNFCRFEAVGGGWSLLSTGSEYVRCNLPAATGVWNEDYSYEFIGAFVIVLILMFTYIFYTAYNQEDAEEEQE